MSAFKISVFVGRRKAAMSYIGFDRDHLDPGIFCASVTGPEQPVSGIRSGSVNRDI